MGITEVLTIIFVICKLFGVISWSWWLVLLPELLAIGMYIFIWLCTIGVVGAAVKKIEKETGEKVE